MVFRVPNFSEFRLFRGHCHVFWSLLPARLLTLPLDRCGGVLGRQRGIAGSILLSLGAYFHKPDRSLGDVESAVERRHAPCEIGAAGIRAGVPLVGRGALEAASVIRPFPGADGCFAPA